jgi:serine kinase of HPr protein (carbohydrate metabolism regulator)
MKHLEENFKEIHYFGDQLIFEKKAREIAKFWKRKQLCFIATDNQSHKLNLLRESTKQEICLLNKDNHCENKKR